MTTTMRKIKTFATGAAAVIALALPVAANAADETLDASFSLEPQSGKFLNNGFKPANWRAEGAVSVPAGEPEILPSKVIDIGNPQGEVTFNPGNMPVCGPRRDRAGPHQRARRRMSSPVVPIRFWVTARHCSPSTAFRRSCWTASWSPSTAG